MIEPAAKAWLPTDPPRPCPEVLTREEAIVYLRLDKASVKNPERVIDHYRREGRLAGVLIGRRIMFRRVDLDEFLERQMEDVPR